MITLQQLIQVAPFSEEVRQELLSTQETLPDAKKFELTALCWQLISQEYENHVDIAIANTMYKIALGEEINPEEEEKKIEERAIHDLAIKLGVVEDEAKVAEVKEELEKIRVQQTTLPQKEPQNN